MTLTFKQVHPNDLHLIEVILPSIGNPTKEKVQHILESYQADDHRLIGTIINDRIVGIIGIKLNKNTAIIKHISILESFRKQGIARKLVQHIIDYFSLKELYAETDEDAVGFYRSLGFKCKEADGKYGVRYQCQFNKKL